MTSTDARVVFCTFPSPDKAGEIARVLVTEKLAACVNILDALSIYVWKDELQNDNETLAIIKTSADCFEALTKRIVELHPYEVPEVIALPVLDGHTPYLAWLADRTH
jgi:periplasmic divalent cation tolerance protein